MSLRENHMATTFGKPYSLLLLEIEEQIVAKGENRPLIVEAAYRKIIKEYGESLTEDERVILGAFRLIMEELALKNTLQINAARKIQSNEAVQRWGAVKIPGWDALKPDHQLARLLGGISSDAKAKAHAICVEDGTQVGDGGWKFEFDDPQLVTEKIAKVFLIDINNQQAALP
jgi:hypothetical protein